MSFHFFRAEQIECPECECEFVPFESPQACPRCGCVVTSETEFLADILSGLEIHRSDYGCYTAGAYFVGSPAENVFHWCCRVLDAAEKEAGSASLEPEIDPALDQVDWGEAIHMRKYFSQLLARVITGLSERE